MKKFDHMGLPVDEKQPNEMYVPATKVWVTDPLAHPYRVEYLRYEPDTSVSGPVRNMPHMAFEVDNLEEAMAGTPPAVITPEESMAAVKACLAAEHSAATGQIVNVDGFN